jgi:hypothetical protein
MPQVHETGHKRKRTEEEQIEEMRLTTLGNLHDWRWAKRGGAKEIGQTGCQRQHYWCSSRASTQCSAVYIPPSFPTLQCLFGNSCGAVSHVTLINCPPPDSIRYWIDIYKGKEDGEPNLVQPLHNHSPPAHRKPSAHLMQKVKLSTQFCLFSHCFSFSHMWGSAYRSRRRPVQGLDLQQSTNSFFSRVQMQTSAHPSLRFETGSTTTTERSTLPPTPSRTLLCFMVKSFSRYVHTFAGIYLITTHNLSFLYRKWCSILPCELCC